ncbi:hypothetical protein BDV25DRAFT_135048 [Aspergillus avenaceus]|uniref:Uncharacterized protein n=1 Tax=Aspergillus avenaceus TaxID=36643 RepID=A0A5N6UAR1_ASPAV|nr:hypothetical protein BDV25DRAFT_135048 [Aspergillus avenaceus]
MDSPTPFGTLFRLPPELRLMIWNCLFTTPPLSLSILQVNSQIRSEVALTTLNYTPLTVETINKAAYKKWYLTPICFPGRSIRNYSPKEPRGIHYHGVSGYPFQLIGKAYVQIFVNTMDIGQIYSQHKKLEGCVISLQRENIYIRRLIVQLTIVARSWSILNDYAGVMLRNGPEDLAPYKILHIFEILSNVQELNFERRRASDLPVEIYPGWWDVELFIEDKPFVQHRASPSFSEQFQARMISRLERLALTPEVPGTCERLWCYILLGLWRSHFNTEEADEQRKTILKTWFEDGDSGRSWIQERFCRILKHHPWVVEELDPKLELLKTLHENLVRILHQVRYKDSTKPEYSKGRGKLSHTWCQEMWDHYDWKYRATSPSIYSQYMDKGGFLTSAKLIIDAWNNDRSQLQDGGSFEVPPIRDDTWPVPILPRRASSRRVFSLIPYQFRMICSLGQSLIQP